MSLAQRLSTVKAARSNQGCATCQWVGTLSDEDRKAVESWIDDGLSILQLHDIVTGDEDNPLPVSESAFRNHIRKHHRSAQ